MNTTAISKIHEKGINGIKDVLDAHDTALETKLDKYSTTTEPSTPVAGEIIEWLEDGLIWRKDDAGLISCDAIGYREHTDFVEVDRPVGAVIVSTSGAQVNPIKIKLPQGGSSTMMSFYIDIYDYETGGIGSTILIHGYNSDIATGWYKYDAFIVAGRNDIRVRFGYDGSKNCVILGDNSGNDWNYAIISVRNFVGKWTNFNGRKWDADWAISFESDVITGYTYTGDVIAEAPFSKAGGIIDGDVVIDSDPSSTPLTVNRKGSNGVIQSFQKDGVEVAKIISILASTAGLVLDPRVGGSGYGATIGGIFATDENGDLSNGTRDLGISAGRFKNAYISGKVIGTTGREIKSDTEPSTPAAGEIVEWLEDDLLWRKDDAGLIYCDQIGYQEHSDFVECRRPKGASLIGTANDVTDAVKITFPQSWTTSMLNFTLDIFEYIGENNKIIISGYSPASAWGGEKATDIGGGATGIRVRFGHDGSKCCIVIGDEGSMDWDLSRFTVKDFAAHFQGFGARKWPTDWTIEFISSVAGITFSGDVTT